MPSYHEIDHPDDYVFVRVIIRFYIQTCRNHFFFIRVLIIFVYVLFFCVESLNLFRENDECEIRFHRNKYFYFIIFNK